MLQPCLEYETFCRCDNSIYAKLNVHSNSIASDEKKIIPLPKKFKSALSEVFMEKQLKLNCFPPLGV